VACGADGRIEVRGVVACDDPSFVVLHPHLPLAYAVNERSVAPGGLTVIALGEGGAGTPVVRLEAPLAGELPCHLAVLPDGSGLVVVHFRCATVQWLGLDVHGLPDGRTAWVRHAGSGPHPRRQAAAHAHCVLALGGELDVTDLYVADLGMDAVVHYRVRAPAAGRDDGADGWTLVEQSRLAVHAGAGPRHLCAAADGRTLWLCNEIDNSVSTLRRLPDGSLREEDWTHALPAGEAGRSATSEIALHPSGRWLYVGNRGHDSIVRFELDERGTPRSPVWVPCGGAHPRHFALAPAGDLLLVANRDSDVLQAFAVDARDGTLAARAVQLQDGSGGVVPNPACVRWLP
jgi:6-phosphogluconolactonase